MRWTWRDLPGSEQRMEKLKILVKDEKRVVNYFEAGEYVVSGPPAVSQAGDGY